MRGFIALLGRFRRDERGAFMVIFGILAIVLIAAAGAVVDFTSVEQARTRAQIALDSAALGLQPTIYSTPAPTEATLKSQALEVLNSRVEDDTVAATVDTATFNTTDGTLHLEAEITVPTAFVQLIGINDIKARIVSEATRKKLNIEVAMVLDNSISMNQNSRMDNLKKAAKSATKILYSNAATQPNVFVGVVPFTEFVNVGTGNKTATWMDQTGKSTMSLDNFDNDDNDSKNPLTAFPVSAPKGRFSLYDTIKVTWSGCVQARNHVSPDGGSHYYDTSDLAPDKDVPDSLFAPIFNPDQPDASTQGVSYDNNYLSDRPAACTGKDSQTWTWTQAKKTCDKDADNGQSNYDNATCTGGTTNTYTETNASGANYTPAATTQPASLFDNVMTSCSTTYSHTGTSTTGSGSKKKTYYDNQKKVVCQYKFSDRELQERLCKYASGTKVTISSSNFQGGPNADCGVALQPLTNVRQTVDDKIDAMGPDGGTNIQIGVMWGYHMLSPTAPLTDAKGYDTAVSKSMIVMTDGENTAGTSGDWRGETWYQAYGYPYSGHISGDTTALQNEMDTRTVTTCNNAKRDGIIIYTIGLATNKTGTPPGANQAKVEKMLKDCSSGPGYYFFPTDPTALDATFQTIAKQLSKLRLSL